MKRLNALNRLRKEFQGVRKISLILSVALVLVLLLSTAALAATNGPHGNFTTSTAACASCHKTHTASTSRLITFTLGAGTQNDTYKTCTYCHSSTGSSKYNVVDGQIVETTNKWASVGGGFQNMATLEGASTFAATTAVTSKHNADAAMIPTALPTVARS